MNNGLTVLAEQDKSTALCAINVLYKVGSKNEEKEKTGFAHLFEHLMFGGSTHAEEFDNIIQNAGGECNAFTNSDYTNYYEVLPAENIETALWVEADRMANLKLNEETLAIQKKVVIEEFREVCLNKPYGDNWHLLSALAYQSHPYNWPTIGKELAHIARAEIGDVAHFYNKFYTPSNAILTVSGPHEVDKVFDLVEKWFGSIDSGIQIQQTFSHEDPQKSYRYHLAKARVPFSQFIGGCHMPGRNDSEYYACDLLSDILANGKSSRLYRRLVRDKKIMTSVDCYLTGTVDPGLIIFEGRPTAEFNVTQALDEIWNEVREISNNPPDQRELQKVKNKVISSLAISDLTILNKAISMAYFEWLGAIDLMNEQEKMYHNVQIQDVIEVAGKYLNKDLFSLVEYQPQQ